MLRRLQHPGRLDRRINGGVSGRGPEEVSLPLLRRARSGRPGRLRCAGAGRVSPVRAAAGRATASAAWDASFGATPNLVVVDGGRGQLSAALEAIHSTYDLPRVAVVALAKREEEVYVPGHAEPIVLDRHDPGLQLLQRIRDEAHRSALRLPSPPPRHQGVRVDLRHAAGVGPARRRAILRHFGSADRFLEASQEELEGVPGLPARTARALYAQLHKTGGSRS